MYDVHTATAQWTLPMEPERYEPLKHPITNQNFRHTCGHCGAGYRASFSIPATASSTVTCVVPATTQLHACNACIFKFPPPLYCKTLPEQWPAAAVLLKLLVSSGHLGVAMDIQLYASLYLSVTFFF